MKPWLQIDGDPDGATINLVPQGRPGTATLGGLVVRALKSLPPIERPLSVPGIEAAPTSSMDVELDNADGALTRLWADRPPMRRAARVLTEDGVLFSGIVTGLQMGATVRVNLEAGMDRPLSDTVPLRTSARAALGLGHSDRLAHSIQRRPACFSAAGSPDCRGG